MGGAERLRSYLSDQTYQFVRFVSCIPLCPSVSWGPTGLRSGPFLKQDISFHCCVDADLCETTYSSRRLLKKKKKKKFRPAFTVPGVQMNSGRKLDSQVTVLLTDVWPS